MLNLKEYSTRTNEYSLAKARKILEEDGTLLSESELQQIVNVLTLLAQQEAEFFTEGNTRSHE